MTIHQVNALPSWDTPIAAVDIETTVLYGSDADPFRDRIISIQVSDGENDYILRDNYSSVIPMLVNPEIKKLGHGLSFDLRFLNHQLGIETFNVHDTLIIERVLTAGDNTRGNGLGEVLARRCGVFSDKTIRDQFKNHVGPMTQQQIEYAAMDVHHLLNIYQQQVKEISNFGMGKIMALENALVPVVVQMELMGVAFDRELWNKCVSWVEQKIDLVKTRTADLLELQKQYSLLGGLSIPLNMNSGDQVLDQLRKLGYILLDTNETTLQDFLVTVTSDSVVGQFVECVLEYRGLEKLKNADYPKYINPTTGKIHSSFNQVQARTGRFSSSNPNLQNVRHPTEGEPNFREPFMAYPGYTLLGADFSTQEPKIMAQISGDENMRKASNSTDMYSALGSIAYGEEITKKDPRRQMLKITLLGDAYGSGVNNTARQLGASVEVAQNIRAELRKSFPGFYKWAQNQKYFAAQNGYVKTIWGRRNWVLGAKGASSDDLNRYERIAVNSPIQGSAADITKLAMVKLADRLRERALVATFCLQVHDEIVLQCPDEQIEDTRTFLETSMLDAMQEICPDVMPKVDSYTNKRWGSK